MVITRMDFIKLGEIIREARLSKRITQADAAKAAGLHPVTVSTLERAQATDIGVRKLSALLGVLGLELVVRPRGQNYTLDDIAKELRQPVAANKPSIKRVRKAQSAARRGQL